MTKKTLSKNDLIALRKEGIKVVKKKVPVKHEKQDKKPVRHDTDIIDIAAKAANISLNAIDNMQKNNAKITALLEAKPEHPKSCRLKVNRDNQGLIETIDIIRD